MKDLHNFNQTYSTCPSSCLFCCWEVYQQQFRWNFNNLCPNALFFYARTVSDVKGFRKLLYCIYQPRPGLLVLLLSIFFHSGAWFLTDSWYYWINVLFALHWCKIFEFLHGLKYAGSKFVQLLLIDVPERIFFGFQS